MFSEALSNIGKWGWSAKTDKTRNLRFYDSRIVGYKKITKQKFKVLKTYLGY